MDTLPNEMIAHITSFADRFDVKALRCVSHVLCSLSKAKKHINSTDALYAVLGYCSCCLTEGKLVLANVYNRCAAHADGTNMRLHCFSQCAHPNCEDNRYCGQSPYCSHVCKFTRTSYNCESYTMGSSTLSLEKCTQCNKKSVLFAGKCRVCHKVVDGVTTCEELRKLYL